MGDGRAVEGGLLQLERDGMEAPWGRTKEERKRAETRECLREDQAETRGAGRGGEGGGR